MKKFFYPLTVFLLFSLTFFALISYFEESEAAQTWVLQTRDLFFKIRRLSSPLPDAMNEMVLVTIDDASCEKLGARWPWPRKLFASLIDALARSNTAVVGLNLAFTGLEGEEEASTLLLSESMRRQGNTVVGAVFDKENRLIKPHPLLLESHVRYGYLEKIVDPDLSIRRSYLVRPYRLQRVLSGAGALVETGQFSEYSFPLQVLAAWKGSDLYFHPDEGWVEWDKKRRVFVDEDGSYPINYLADGSDFHKIPAWKIIQGRFRPEEVKGKIVLVGLASSLLADMHSTPFGIMPGAAIHANEVLAIVSGRLLRFAPGEVTLGISWLVSILVLSFFLFRSFWVGLLGYGACFSGAFLLSQMAFLKDVVVEPFYLLFGTSFAAVAGGLANSFRLLLEKQGLETKVIHDKMTGLYTYDFLRWRLEDEWRRCEKLKLPVAVAMTDLDHFKKINDTLGHEVGNEMIKRAGAVIKESVRGYDVVARYGGDEFVVLLWHASLEDAKDYRNRLRSLYEAMARTLEPALQDSSISIGVAAFDPRVNPKFPSRPQQLIEEADQDLFMDKKDRRKEAR
ncbi:MAG: diguanylate cyclase [Candidatus Omnitrophica bacterium]|nr:diguanylate cyclase [Candidatus Omnitrophota bacterium]